MKRTLTLTAMALTLSLAATAQSYDMNVALKDGTVRVIAVDDISEITWVEHVEPLYSTVSTALPSLTHGRMNCHAIVDGEKIVVLGGHCEDFEIDYSVEVFADGVWTPLDVSIAHDNACQALMADGRTLILGGTGDDGGSGTISDAHIYDPATGQLTQTGSLRQPRALCGAVALKDGKVLVAGNWYDTATTIELFDPATETFTLGPAGLPREIAMPYIFPTADGGAAILAAVDRRGRKNWDGNYIKYTPDGSITNIAAEGMEGLRPSVTDNVYPECVTSDGRYIFQAYDDEQHNWLVSFDPATEEFARVLQIDPQTDGISAPVVNIRTWVNKAKDYVHVIVFDNNDVNLMAIKTYDLATGEEIHCGLLQQNQHITTVRMMPDGRLIFVGGSTDGSNYNPHRNVYIVKPV